MYAIVMSYAGVIRVVMTNNTLVRPAPIALRRLGTWLSRLQTNETSGHQFAKIRSGPEARWTAEFEGREFGCINEYELGRINSCYASPDASTNMSSDASTRAMQVRMHQEYELGCLCKSGCINSCTRCL
jgi:hypothetical protein